MTSIFYSSGAVVLTFGSICIELHSWAIYLSNWFKHFSYSHVSRSSMMCCCSNWGLHLRNNGSGPWSIQEYRLISSTETNIRGFTGREYRILNTARIYCISMWINRNIHSHFVHWLTMIHEIDIRIRYLPTANKSPGDGSGKKSLDNSEFSPSLVSNNSGLQ